MRNTSLTLITILKNHVEQWRKENDYSRETAVAYIVEAHEALGADVITGIRFDPHIKDAYERMKVNSCRVYRWLDDVTTDKNLLPTNFIPSILAALPVERRVACVSEMFAPIGLVASATSEALEGELDVNRHLPSIMKETHEALQAVVHLQAGVDDKNLLSAHQEIDEAIQSMTRFQRLVKRAIAVRSKIGKALRVVGGKK